MVVVAVVVMAEVITKMRVVLNVVGVIVYIERGSSGSSSSSSSSS